MSADAGTRSYFTSLSVGPRGRDAARRGSQATTLQRPRLDGGGRGTGRAPPPHGARRKPWHPIKLWVSGASHDRTPPPWGSWWERIDAMTPPGWIRRNAAHCPRHPPGLIWLCSRYWSRAQQAKCSGAATRGAPCMAVGSARCVAQRDRRTRASRIASSSACLSPTPRRRPSSTCFRSFHTLK